MKILLKYVVLIIIFLAFIGGVKAQDCPEGMICKGVMPSGNNGGFTPEGGAMPLGGVIPSDQSGGFTDTQEQFLYDQPTSGNSWGNSADDSWGTPGSNYLTQKPNDYGQFSDTGTAPGFGAQTPAGGQPGPSALWIVDPTGLNRYPEMSIPLYGYAREEITPSVEGQITREEKYPDGKVETYSLGYVRPYHVYKMWFYGDVPGTHMVRYNINGYYTNTIRFYVQGSGSQSQSNPAVRVGTGSTITRSGSTIIRSGGSMSSGFSSTSVSGGSMSISTSFG